MVDFNFNSWNTPAEEPTPTPEPEPVEEVSTPTLESEPEPVEQTPVLEPEKPKPVKKRKPARAKGVTAAQVDAVLQADTLAELAEQDTDTVAFLTGKSERVAQVAALTGLQSKYQTGVGMVQKILELCAMFDDEQARQVAETVTGKSEMIDAVASLLSGKTESLRLLIEAHDAASQVEAQKLFLQAGDVKDVRDAARVALVLAPELEGVVSPGAGTQVDIALALGVAARDIDVERVRGLLV